MNLTMNDNEINRQKLKQQNLPDPPEGNCTNLRWIARWNDWYCEVDNEWYWYDERSKIWMNTIYVP